MITQLEQQPLIKHSNNFTVLVNINDIMVQVFK